MIPAISFTPSLPVSRTLARLGLSPNSVCAHCRHGIWHQATTRLPTAAGQQPSQQQTDPAMPVAMTRVYCALMSSLIDTELTACDGQEPPEPASPVP